MTKELLIRKFPRLFDVVGDFKLKFEYNYYDYEKDNHIKTKFNSMFATDIVVAAYRSGNIVVDKDVLDFGSNRFLLICKNGTILQFTSSEWAAITIIKG